MWDADIVSRALPSSDRSLLVARNSLWLTIDGAVSFVVSFVLSIAVARTLGPDRLGFYSYVPVQNFLRIRERQDFLIRFGTAMMVVNIALDLWWIPAGGAMGAAWANGVAQTLSAAGVAAYASARLGLSAPWAGTR